MGNECGRTVEGNKGMKGIREREKGRKGVRDEDTKGINFPFNFSRHFLLAKHVL
jgi:hypothetical protein